mgnify:CR=1 FL=1
MSNEKIKEPATTGSSTPEPVVKKKRGRKRTKKQYFTADVDAAIKEFLASSNQEERNNIYKNRIHYAFYKLAENLIHTFKFYYTEVESLEDLKHEVCCFFLEKLDYFKPEKGSKAFSYFSIVGKNYLILYNNNNYKKKKQKADPLAADEDEGVLRQLGRDERKKDIKDFIDYFTEYIDKNYIYIREMTGVETPVITKVTKVLKKLYRKLYTEYADTGYVRS